MQDSQAWALVRTRVLSKVVPGRTQALLDDAAAMASQYETNDQQDNPKRRPDDGISTTGQHTEQPDDQRASAKNEQDYPVPLTGHAPSMTDEQVQP